MLIILMLLPFLEAWITGDKRDAPPAGATAQRPDPDRDHGRADDLLRPALGRGRQRHHRDRVQREHQPHHVLHAWWRCSSDPSSPSSSPAAGASRCSAPTRRRCCTATRPASSCARRRVATPNGTCRSPGVARTPSPRATATRSTSPSNGPTQTACPPTAPGRRGARAAVARDVRRQRAETDGRRARGGAPPRRPRARAGARDGGSLRRRAPVRRAAHGGRRRAAQPLSTKNLTRWGVLTGLVLLSFNLRPAAVSVGPVLAEVRDGLGMSSLTAACSPPCRCSRSRSSAPWHPRLAAAVGVHRVTLLSLLARRRRAGRPRAVGHDAVVPGPLAARAGRDGHRQRAAAVPGQAALPRPHRPGHRDLHDRAGDRADLARSVLTVPISRRVRRLALRPGRLGASLAAGRGAPVARPASPTTGTSSQAGTVRFARRRPHPARLGDGAASSGCSRCRRTRSSAGSPSSGATPASPPRRPGCCSGSSPAMSIPLSLWLPAAVGPPRPTSALILPW